MLTKAFWLDLLERTTSGAAAALLAVLTVPSIDWTHKAQVTGTAALAVILKCLIASRVGATDSGSLLPAKDDPPVTPDPNAGPSFHGDLVHDPAVHLTGKAPARHDRRTLHLSSYLTPLPHAPASTSRASKIRTWGMLGNDKLGDCTCAAAGHMIKLWTSLAGHVARISTAQVVSAYSAVTGYTPKDPASDQGAVELDVLNYWRKTGIASHRIGAYAKVNPRDHALVQTASWIFDGLYIGLQLPLSAQRQTVWDVVAGPAGAAGSWGGHAVDVVDHNATGPVVITWGAPKQLTWAFWDRYCDEAYALISPDALHGGKTVEGFDAAALQQDLAQL